MKRPAGRQRCVVNPPRKEGGRGTFTPRGARVVVVGQGYVGLPLAMHAVEVGDVVGYDVDERRAKRLEAADSYVEDVPDAQLAAALASGRYRASTEAKACAASTWR